MIGPAVSLTDVRTGYRSLRGRREVLHGVSMSAEPGTVTGLVGRNGAGKTTLVRVLLGLIPSWAGEAFVGGLAPRVHRRRRGVGYLPEIVSLPRGWRLGPFVRYGALLSGLTSEAAAATADEALGSVDLTERRHDTLSSLSKGMSRRAALAFALAGNPGLVVLDEPMSGLDAAARVAVRTAVAHWRARGCTIVVSSHELTEVLDMADSVHVVREGRIAAAYTGDLPAARTLERAILGEG